jgi:misacylated tRNA(Ala) deacylase
MTLGRFFLEQTMSGTQLLYLEDSYLRTFSARIGQAEEHNVVLDRTAFYPRSGGQMADRGWLEAGGKRYPVIAVEKRGDQVVHTLEGTPPVAGSEVRGEIDWDFRYQMMRTHTALHVLCGVIYHQYGSQVTGCQMYPDRARMDFTLADLSPERVAEIERLSNEAVAAGYPVRIRFIPRAEANTTPELIRTKINLVPPQVDPVRTVEIVGLDLQADGGTHVANTIEIGSIRVVKTENKGRENRRLEIALSPLPQSQP